MLAGGWRHHSWDDEHLVYCEASGDTHKVTTEGLALLEALSAGPASEAELIERLGGDIEEQSTRFWVIDALAAFRRLGLVE